MAGRFEGLSDQQWILLEPLFESTQIVIKRRPGRPESSKRQILNSILYILITGSRWCDLPKGDQWASRSTAHRWLRTWSRDGTLKIAMDSLRSVTELNQLIDWSAVCVDGSFSPR